MMNIDTSMKYFIKSIIQCGVMQFDSKSVVSTLANRVSIREYLDKPVDDEMIDIILETARRAPTSSNLQVYSFVVVRDEVKKKKLAKLAGNQKHIETCGAFIGICADISRLHLACEMHGTTLARNLENSMVSIIDAAIAGTSASITAESLGLGTVMIGGIRNHPRDVAEVLDLPKGCFVVFGLCVGWPDWDRVKNQKPRMHKSALTHFESYTPVSKQDLENYDENLAEHYRSEGKHITQHAWTGRIASRFSNPRRTHLRGELEDLGFKFE